MASEIQFPPNQQQQQQTRLDSFHVSGFNCFPQKKEEEEERRFLKQQRLAAAMETILCQPTFRKQQQQDGIPRAEYKTLPDFEQLDPHFSKQRRKRFEKLKWLSLENVGLVYGDDDGVVQDSRVSRQTYNVESIRLDSTFLDQRMGKDDECCCSSINSLSKASVMEPHFKEKEKITTNGSNDDNEEGSESETESVILNLLPFPKTHLPSFWSPSSPTTHHSLFPPSSPVTPLSESSMICSEREVGTLEWAAQLHSIDSSELLAIQRFFQFTERDHQDWYRNMDNDLLCSKNEKEIDKSCLARDLSIPSDPIELPRQGSSSDEDEHRQPCRLRRHYPRRSHGRKQGEHLSPPPPPPTSSSPKRLLQQKQPFSSPPTVRSNQLNYSTTGYLPTTTKITRTSTTTTTKEYYDSPLFLYYYYLLLSLWPSTYLFRYTLTTLHDHHTLIQAQLVALLRPPNSSRYWLLP